MMKLLFQVNVRLLVSLYRRPFGGVLEILGVSLGRVGEGITLVIEDRSRQG